MEEKQTVFKFNDYEWQGIKTIEYKPKNQKDMKISFNDVKRQNIFESKDGINFDMRYFECALGGYTSLEKHEHAHVVMVMRGKGQVIIGQDVYDVNPYDLFVIPSYKPHQLINTGDEPFGFVCTVNAVRDKFQLLSKDEIDALKKIKKVDAAMRIPDTY